MCMTEHVIYVLSFLYFQINAGDAVINKTRQMGGALAPINALHGAEEPDPYEPARLLQPRGTYVYVLE